MLSESIYLLIYNNLQCMYTRSYTIEFFKTILLLFGIYTLPILVFTNIINLSSIDFINDACLFIYNYFYFIPSYAIIYVVHNSKLSKLLEKKYILQNNPHHIYLSLLYGFIYLICSLIGILFKQSLIIIYVCDTISLSLFYNEVGYCFLDNSKYYFNNRIDFYNANYKIFVFYALMTSLIINQIPIIFFIPVSYIVISFFQNIFIDYPYNCHNPDKYFRNLMYYIEKIVNIIITFLSTFIFFSFERRTIISEPI